MSNLKERLEDCFEVAFPDVPKEQIPQASVSSLAIWDSLTMLTLVALIEEEFDIQTSSDDLGQMISFELILDLLKTKHHAGIA